MAVRNRAHRPDAERCHRCGHEAHEGRTQTIRRPAHAGSRLKLRDVLGRLRLKGQPSSRTGENSPYGMIGGIEETSASFEARSAPRSYPTWLCKNSTRYNRTRNFEPYDHAESKKTQKFVFRSVLRPNQISFSHSPDPEPTLTVCRIASIKGTTHGTRHRCCITLP